MALFSKQATTAKNVKKGDIQVHWVQSSVGLNSDIQDKVNNAMVDLQRAGHKIINITHNSDVGGILKFNNQQVIIMYEYQGL